MTTPERYAHGLAALLPRGALWRLDPESWLWKVLLVLGDAFAAVDARIEDFKLEQDPRTATETLGDWETMLGVTSPAGTTAARQAEIAARYTARGGVTAEYITLVAAAQGVSITISYYVVCRSGRARSGDRIYGVAWAYAAKITLPASTPNHAAFEASLRAAAPAHVVLVFNYV